MKQSLIKWTFLAVLFIVFVYLCLRPCMVLSKKQIDIGRCNQGEIIQCWTAVKNIGFLPLYIINITRSCGCTEVSYANKYLKHGESMRIGVKLSTDTVSKHFKRRISIRTSELFDNYHSVIIKGYSVPSPLVKKKELYLGIIKEDEYSNVSIDIKYPGNENREIMKVASPQFIKVRIDKRKGDEQKILLCSKQPIGRFDDKVTLVFDNNFRITVAIMGIAL